MVRYFMGLRKIIWINVSSVNLLQDGHKEIDRWRWLPGGEEEPDLRIRVADPSLCLVPMLAYLLVFT
jgi:hypothetical protein